MTEERETGGMVYRPSPRQRAEQAVARADARLALYREDGNPWRIVEAVNELAVACDLLHVPSGTR